MGMSRMAAHRHREPDWIHSGRMSICAAQTRLTDSVVREAQNPASNIQYDRLVPMGLFALICLVT